MPRRVHYVLSTHWDREWHHTFQDFRYRLVQLLDRVLAGWQDGSLQGPFQTDGQVVLLDDYLEIRPERQAEIEQRLHEGKLIAGPWYVLPDEFLVSGESLVRNLRLGRETARRFGGKPSHAGFLCDMFGHNSQMPQIFAGFGIHGAFLWRGTNLYDRRHFIWRGADGSEIASYRFPGHGYCTYAVAVRAADRPQRPTPAEIAARLESHLQAEAQATVVSPILAFDGGDHMEWDQGAYAVLARRFVAPEGGQRFGETFGDFEIVHSSLDVYLEELMPEKGKILPLQSGELREPALAGVTIDQQWLIPGVTSSRVWIKQANQACESLLCQWAEPFSVLSQLALGQQNVEGFLNAAWKWLISNHPHDSMCGCSIDAVHEDMRYRFSQAQAIANRLTLEATSAMAACAAGSLEDGELRVAVFNPLPRPRTAVIDLTLDTPLDWPVFGQEMGTFEPQPAFRIYDPDGIEIPYQRLSQAARRARTRMFDVTFPQSYKVNEVGVALRLELPPLGYTTFTVRSTSEPTRLPPSTGLASSECSLENEFLMVVVEVNGSLTLTDKRSGQIYSRLLTFEDRADIGDGWNYGAVTGDQSYTSAAVRADVAVVKNGPLLGALRVGTTLPLPAEFHFESMRRSTHFENLVIDNLLTLRAGSDHLQVETTVHNNVCDHRLRVLFPSGAAAAQTYLADTPFDVVERPIALRADNHLYREPEVETKPQQTWSSIFAESPTPGGCGRGLALVSAGLLESAVIDTPERPLALTLFRATRRTVGTDGEPLGQLQGEMKFRYWIVPLNTAADRTRLCELGQRLAAGLRCVQLTPADFIQPHAAVELPASAGFLRLEGQVVLTSLRQVNGGLEARFFNPTPSHQRARLDLSGWAGSAPAPRTAGAVDLESRPTSAPEPLVEGQIAFALLPKQILTLRLK